MIDIKDVEFYYSSDKLILDGISFHLDAGSYLSILGENGAGKSTLIKLLLQLEKPTKGSIVCNTDRIGYVPQKRETMIGLPLKVYEFLYSYQKILHIKEKNTVDRVLNETGTAHLSQQLIGNLSGGQLQRVFIARALIGNPDLIILDEPSSGIDNDGQKRVYSLVKDLHEHGKTIISVEHNIQAAVRYSSVIFHMAKTHGHLCSPERYAKEYLGLGAEEI